MPLNTFEMKWYPRIHILYHREVPCNSSIISLHEYMGVISPESVNMDVLDARSESKDTLMTCISVSKETNLLFSLKWYNDLNTNMGRN